jgi:uridine kinase
VGIAGGSGSGKSTLARAFFEALGPAFCAVVSFDDYYRDLSHLDPAERARANFDHPDSLDDELFGRHLDLLREGRAVEVPVYDFASHSRTGACVRVEPRAVVVVEGILLLAVEAIADRLDLSVFVEAQEAVRLARRIARDAVERGRSEASVRAQYAATVGPMYAEFVGPSARRADLRVSGEAAFGPVVRDLVDRVERVLKTGFEDP